eukprot:TRINITY_DN35715_c0_g1_i1.p1 TRINITY_DN35715_c0_g1~~TRINITY_DN35715_c0_g1_i1.p1  ORF type:complete len:173 (-),score=50.62 TRINITY_DN35715_c0_g1_i1:22-540(-)
MEFSPIDPYPGHKVALAYYKNITNMAVIKQKLMKNEINAALVKPELILSQYHVLVAATKAYANLMNGCLLTHNINTELIHCLSATAQIAGNLRKFGSSETDTSVVVVIFNKTDEEAMKTVPIKGDIQPLAALSEQDNKMSVAKVYKLTEEEKKRGDERIELSVIARISARDL